MQHHPHHPGLLLDTRADGPGGIVLLVDGEIDLETAPRLREMLAGALDDHDRVLLDLQRVTFMDSTGIAMLLHAAEAARRNGTELAVDPSRAIRRLLELVGVEAALVLR